MRHHPEENKRNTNSINAVENHKHQYEDNLKHIITQQLQRRYDQRNTGRYTRPYNSSHYVPNLNKSETRFCQRCRSSTHFFENCRRKNKICDFCGKVGHVFSECFKLKNVQFSQQRQNYGNSGTYDRPDRHHYLNEDYGNPSQTSNRDNNEDEDLSTALKQILINNNITNRVAYEQLDHLLKQRKSPMRNWHTQPRMIMTTS